MIKKIQSLLFSPITTNVLLIVIAVFLGVATFVEHASSTQTARLWFYNNPVFYILLLLASANLAGIVWQGGFRNLRKAGMLIFHGAFLFILIGAWTTRTFAYDGLLHIRQGETSDQLHITEASQGGFTDEVRTLPFRITLDQFKLTRYPGSNSPSSFESFLSIENGSQSRSEHIFMNKVIHEQGFRLYQSSYDPDEKGTVLSVNFDPYGTIITYIGYLLLLIGVLFILIGRHSRFAMLRRELKGVSAKALLTILLLGSSIVVSAQEPSAADARRYAPTEAHAQRFGSLLVQSPEGRIEPINTYTSKLLRKLSRSSDFMGLSSDQTILGIITYPDFWNQVPFISLKSKEVAALLNIPDTKRIAYSSLFDNDGAYKLKQRVDKIYAQSPKERSSLDKEILKLDEKANILFALQNGEYLSIFPLEGDPDHNWYSPGDDLSAFVGQDSLFVNRIFGWYINNLHQAIGNGSWKEADDVLQMIATYQHAKSDKTLIDAQRIEWEIDYNRWNIFDRSALPYILLSLTLLLSVVIGMFRPSKGLRWLTYAASAAIVLLFALNTFGFALRWYISAQAPFSNAYESMIFVAWASALAGLLFIRRSPITLSLAALLAGVVLFVSHLNFMDPQITPLVPVLKSPWLMIHVAVITASYGFFGMSFLLGIVSWIVMAARSTPKQSLSDRVHELRIINELSLTIGLCLMTLGTFLGAIWANESWGRYWGWDPKETWALITMLIYALVLHARFIKTLRSDFAFSTLSVFALTSVLMTYFGVNYFLSGMHSYGKGDVPPALDAIYWGFGLLVLLALFTGWRLKKQEQTTAPSDSNKTTPKKVSKKV